MNPLILIFTNDGHEVLININSIALVTSQGNGNTAIKLNTFTAPNTNDVVYTRDGVMVINAKIQQAFNA